MKKYLFLLVAVVSLALSSGQAYAQRYLPKMMGVELSPEDDGCGAARWFCKRL